METQKLRKGLFMIRTISAHPDNPSASSFGPSGSLVNQSVGSFVPSESPANISSSTVVPSRSPANISSSTVVVSRILINPSGNTVVLSRSLANISSSTVAPSRILINPSGSMVVPSGSLVNQSVGTFVPSGSPVNISSSTVVPSRSPVNISASTVAPSRILINPSGSTFVPSRSPVNISSSTVVPSRSPVNISASTVVPSGSLVNQSVGTFVPSIRPINPSASTVPSGNSVNTSPTASNPCIRLILKVAPAATPAFKPPSAAVNQTALVLKSSDPGHYRLLREDAPQRLSTSNASISSHRPNSVVVAGDSTTTTNACPTPEDSQPDNAPEDREHSQKQLPPQFNCRASLIWQNHVADMRGARQIRAQYKKLSFDISPDIYPRLQMKDGKSPYYLGSPSYPSVMNDRFLITSHAAGTPLPNGVINFIDTLKDEVLKSSTSRFVYSIFDSNKMDLDILLRFDPRSRMLVLADSPTLAPIRQRDLAWNNENIQQLHNQVQRIEAEAAASNRAPTVAPTIIPLPVLPASVVGELTDSDNDPRVPPKQQLTMSVGASYSEEEERQQDAGPSDLSPRKAATPQATVTRQKKRPAESELPTTNGPAKSIQAKIATSTRKKRSAESELPVTNGPAKSIQAKIATSTQKKRPAESDLPTTNGPAKSIQAKIVPSTRKKRPAESELPTTSGQAQSIQAKIATSTRKKRPTESELPTTSGQAQSIQAKIATSTRKKRPAESELPTTYGPAQSIQAKIVPSTQKKRPAESELPTTNGPAQSIQAKIAASTFSLQTSPRASVRIVARNTQLDESTNKQQEQAVTSPELKRIKQNPTIKVTSNPIQSKANAPAASVSTATDSVASTSTGPSKRSQKIAKVSTSVSTSSNQTDASESQSERSESPSAQSTASDSTSGRYSKRPAKPNVLFSPTHQSSYIKKSKSERKETQIKKVVCPPTAPVSEADVQKDKHCWKCHAAQGELRHCSRCPLGWHTERCCDKIFESKLKSMIMTLRKSNHKPERIEVYAEKQAWVSTLPSVLDPTVCLECARKEAGQYYNKHYGNLVDFEQSQDRSILERSAAMYEYAVKSLMLERGLIKNKTTGEQKRGLAYEPFKRIDYGKHMDMDQIDLEWMFQKAETIDAYQCTEDFMFDIKRICHSYMILQMKQPGIVPCVPKYWALMEQCKQMIASAQIQMDFINRCDSCYRNNYELNSERVKSDMLMPCENPHALVWMVHRHRWWPAKAFDYRESQYYFTSDKFIYVIPFADERKIKWISYKLVRSFSKNPPVPSEEMVEKFSNSPKQDEICAHLLEALSDAKQYYHKYWNEYFTKPYHLPVNDGPITLDDLYLKVKLKPKKNVLDHNFILSSPDGAEAEDDGADNDADADDDDDDDDDETEKADKSHHRRISRPKKSEKPKLTPSTQNKAPTSRKLRRIEVFERLTKYEEARRRRFC